MKTSIIIPCYNEQDNIALLAEHFAPIAEDFPIELVLVDNGSSDNTRAEIARHAEAFPFITPAAVEENQGYGYGILAGLRAAGGDVLGWMHADLQSDPAVFCDMIRRAEGESGDFLYKGSRSNRPVSDTLFTVGMSLYESVYLGAGLWDINAQPTLLSRSFYERWSEPPYDFSLDLYVYYLAKAQKVPVSRFASPQAARLHGESSWNTGMAARVKLIRRVLRYSGELKKKVRGI